VDNIRSIYPTYVRHQNGDWEGWYPRFESVRYTGPSRESVAKQLPIVRVRAGVVLSRDELAGWRASISGIESVTAVGKTAEEATARVQRALVSAVRSDADIAAVFFALRDQPPDDWEVELIPRRELKHRLRAEAAIDQQAQLETGSMTAEGWVATAGSWGRQSDIVERASSIINGERVRADSPSSRDVRAGILATEADQTSRGSVADLD